MNMAVSKKAQIIIRYKSKSIVLQSKTWVLLDQVALHHHHVFSCNTHGLHQYNSKPIQTKQAAWLQVDRHTHTRTFLQKKAWGFLILRKKGNVTEKWWFMWILLQKKYRLRWSSNCKSEMPCSQCGLFDLFWRIVRSHRDSCSCTKHKTKSLLYGLPKMSCTFSSSNNFYSEFELANLDLDLVALNSKITSINSSSVCICRIPNRHAYSHWCSRCNPLVISSILTLIFIYICIYMQGGEYP